MGFSKKAQKKTSELFWENNVWSYSYTVPAQRNFFSINIKALAFMEKDKFSQVQMK